MATATTSARKPAPCDTTVTANAGRRFVSDPPAKSAVPQTSDDPSARASARTFSGSADALDEHRHALPAADAHRLEADGAVERLEIVEQRPHDPRAGHAVRVAERDRAAVRIQLVAERVDAELAAHRQHL